MSIILKGIDIPDEKLMEMFESDNHICIGGNYYPLMIKDVIQIPKGHGRLIDAKVFADTICQAIQSGDLIQKSIWEWIADAPTILEAEEER